MAYRDKTQGFAFSYVDIAKLIRDQQERRNSDPKPQVAPVVNTNKDTLPLNQNSRSVEDVKNHLDRLQALHHKLHAILEELNQATNWKKKS